MNVIPFALMCAGWVVPMLRFWALVWGLYQPHGFVRGDVAPGMAGFAAACAACVAAWWLPSSYDHIRDFERSGRLYEMLGVRWFRKFVPDGDLANRWRRRREPGFRLITGRASAEAHRLRYIASERSHLVLLLAGLATCAYAWSIGWDGWAWYLFAANVPVHLYPILLQRYTRARITRLTDGVSRQRAPQRATAVPRSRPDS